MTGCRLRCRHSHIAGVGRLLSQLAMRCVGAVELEEYELEEEQGLVRVVLRLVDAGRTAVLEEAIGVLLLLGQVGGA